MFNSGVEVWKIQIGQRRKLFSRYSLYAFAFVAFSSANVSQCSNTWKKGFFFCCLFKYVILYIICTISQLLEHCERNYTYKGRQYLELFILNNFRLQTLRNFSCAIQGYVPHCFFWKLDFYMTLYVIHKATFFSAPFWIKFGGLQESPHQLVPPVMD